MQVPFMKQPTRKPKRTNWKQMYEANLERTRLLNNRVELLSHELSNWQRRAESAECDYEAVLSDYRVLSAKLVKQPTLWQRFKARWMRIGGRA